MIIIDIRSKFTDLSDLFANQKGKAQNFFLYGLSEKNHI